MVPITKRLTAVVAGAGAAVALAGCGGGGADEVDAGAGLEEPARFFRECFSDTLPLNQADDSERKSWPFEAAWAYLSNLVQARWASPRDDVVTALVQANGGSSPTSRSSARA